MSTISVVRFKQCTKCGCTKPLTPQFFRPCKRHSDGYRGACRVCDYAYKQNHQRSNPEILKAQNARMYQKHKEKKLALSRAHRLANLEAAKARDRKNYQDNWVARRAQRKKYYQRNKEKWHEWRNKRRMRERGGEGRYTRADVWRLYDEQEGFCYYCDTPLFGTFHTDHRQPVSRGGSNWPENLAITCPTCNSRKQDKTEAEFWEVLKNE